MKQNFSFSTFVFRRGLSFMLCIFLASGYLNGQCHCNGGEFLNPAPFADYNTYVYDSEGFVTAYYHSFQFPCLGDPLEEVPSYDYAILYREKGTTQWFLQYDEINTADYFITAGPFEPCKQYELRVTCPECDLAPLQIICEPYDQVQAFYNDPNAYDNVSTVWTICYSPISTKPINNLHVSSIGKESDALTISWDHLPGFATYEVKIREVVSPLPSFQLVGTTTNYSYELTGLDPCQTYDVQVRGLNPNCCASGAVSQVATLRFVATSCVGQIDKIGPVTGNSATVSWSFLGENAPPVDYLVEWWATGAPNNIFSGTTTQNEYTLTGLTPSAPYKVRVTPNCGADACSGPSQQAGFTTNCELFEPNNSFQTAPSIAFDADFSQVNITPAGDVDYFKFTPTGCDFIEIFIDHPDFMGYGHYDPVYWEANELPYVLYDQNFQEVPMYQFGYDDPQLRWHETVHQVTPGQVYYIAIRGFNNSWDNLDCYTFRISPCWGCDQITGNSISGESNIYTVPGTEYYFTKYSGYHVDWSVAGPATLQQPPFAGYSCTLNFNGTGTVTLTAVIENCNGATATLQKQIQVSDECNLEGTYSHGQGPGVPISTTGFNYLSELNYTITLDIPDGVSYNVYLLSGNATWTKTGKKIIVTQITDLINLRIVLSSGHCYGVSGIYTFFKGGDYPPIPPTEYPVSWELSPNPATNMLVVTPTIAPGFSSFSSLPEKVNMWLFNQSSQLEVYKEGSIMEPTTLNTAGLLPGNYTLLLLYGNYTNQFNVIKQ